MSSYQMMELFSMEMLPSTLAVAGLICIGLGVYKSSVCGSNSTCDDALRYSKEMGIASSVCAGLLGVLALLGVISMPSYGMGGYGGYGGYGGGGWW